VPLRTNAASGGERAVLGIRPNDILVGADGADAIEARIHLIEPLGDVTVVSFDARGQTLRAVLPEAQANRMRPGEAIPIAIDRAKVHVFRASNGLALREPVSA
jgi:multiple sugar transport system ATP-binding protein